VASGYSGGSWLSLPEVGVADLDGAALPDPSDDAGAVRTLTYAGARDDLADPRPDALDMLGIPGRLYRSVWFDRIHIFPRERDLGSVVSEQVIDVEVWNAFLDRAKVLDDIVVTGPAGISVTDHLGVPAEFPASDSQIFEVTVSAEGDPQIDNLVTFEFLGIATEGTGLAIVGFRLIPFPFPPNMATAVDEDFGYLTDVLRSRSGMEQRVQLRAVPIGAIGYSVFLEDRRDAQMAAAILFGNQPRAYGVGRWQFQTPTTAAVSVDDTEVYLDPTSIPFVEGGLVMLWTDPYTWEVLTIDSVEADHLVVTSGFRFAWAAGTAALPMVVGRLSTSEALAWEDLAKISQSLRWTVDGYTP